MESERDQSNKLILLGLIGLVLGLFIGAIVIGYWLWPVQWTDAAPSHLRPDLQEDFLRAAIDSYAVSQNSAQASARYAELGAAGPTTLENIQENPGYQDPAQIQAYSAVVQADTVVVDEETPSETGGMSPALTAFLILLLVLVAVLVVVYLLRWRSRTGQTEQPKTAAEIFTPIEETPEADIEEVEAILSQDDELSVAPAMAAWAVAEAFDGEASEEEIPEELGELIAGEEEFLPEDEEVEPAPEDELAKFSYDLAYIEGIGPVYSDKLNSAGIDTPKVLLERGATPHGRQEIAMSTGISDKLILKWVNHVDLFRIKGVGSEYADLLEAGGVDTVVELATRNPANLYQTLASINMEKRLVRKLPFPSQVEDWIKQAKELPRIISY